MLAAGDDARIIAGGQSLVPLMAMRLARPKRLIDIARIRELAFVRREHEGIAIGAATRQSVLERDPIIRAAVPLLAKVMPFIGHAAIRSRGTIGGSLANADPAAEMALVAVTLGATLVYRDGPASAEIAASDFFVGPMTTALPATACLTAVRFPVWRDARIGVGFHEVSARRSDFALAAAAAQVALDENGICRRLALGVGAVTGRPLRLDAAGRALEGTRAEATHRAPESSAATPPDGVPVSSRVRRPSRCTMPRIRRPPRRPRRAPRFAKRTQRPAARLRRCSPPAPRRVGPARHWSR